MQQAISIPAYCCPLIATRTVFLLYKRLGRVSRSSACLRCSMFPDHRCNSRPSGNWPQCMIFTPDSNRILIRFEKYLIYDPVWILFPDIPHILVFFRLTQGQAVCNHLHVITQTIILSRRTERKAGFVRRATGQCRPAPSTGAALSSNVPPCIRLPARPRCHHCCRQQRPPPAGCRHPHWTAQCQPARPGSWPRRYSCPQ